MRFFLRPRESVVLSNTRKEPPVRSGDPAVAALAASQRGLVTSSQLRGAGLSPGAIAHRVERGRLHPLFRGVYLVGHSVAPPLAPELGALLVIGDDASLSDDTAGSLWSVTSRVEGGDIHVSVPRDLKSREGIRIHSRSLHEDDITLLHGLRITTASRTLLDLAPVLDLDALAQAAERAQMRGLLSRPAVLGTLDRAPRARGSAALREALLLDDEPVILRSKAERIMRRLLRGSGLPQPEINYRLAGRERDFVWREQKLVIELDGWQFHGSRWAFERDRRRDAELVALGYRVLRVTWRRLIREPDAFLAELTRALAATWLGRTGGSFQ